MRLSIAGFIISLLATLPLSAQNVPQPGPTYEGLQLQIELHEGTPKVWPYLKTYLSKAKEEQNWREASFAYKEMLHESKGRLRFAYADSMVSAAERSKNPDIIGAAYLTKGIAHYQDKQHQKALDNYLRANSHLVGSQDHYLRHKVKYTIAQLKFYLGYYEEAIALFCDCVGFFRDNSPIPYLKSLHSLGLCYAYTGKHSLAKATTTLALQESARLKEKSMLPYLDIVMGITSYNAKQYAAAVQLLTDALPLVREDGDFASEATACFYIGKAYWDLGEQEKAHPYFLETERLMTQKNYIRPELRRAYEYLIKYYHAKGRKETELRYIDKLLQADTSLGREFRYLSTRIYKEYDTAELLAEKDKIRQELMRSRWAGGLVTALAAALGLAVVLLVRRQRRLQKLYKKRFDELVTPAQKVHAATPAPEGPLNINPSIVDGILVKLDEFERKKGFLKKGLNAGKLAESFDTNSKYLSKVIHTHRQKTFINYINDLRIDYLVARLKAEPVLRRYTNAALAGEAGFKTAQHFVKAFKKRTGMPPGYFVEEYERLQEK
jgi:AraC-like DNA-binding protein